MEKRTYTKRNEKENKSLTINIKVTQTKKKQLLDLSEKTNKPLSEYTNELWDELLLRTYSDKIDK